MSNSSDRPNFQTRSLASDLSRMASRLREDSDNLELLAQQILDAAHDDPSLPLSAFAPNVLDRVFRALNNSSLIGTAQSVVNAVTKEA